jgi:hypothetical protein
MFKNKTFLEKNDRNGVVFRFNNDESKIRRKFLFIKDAAKSIMDLWISFNKLFKSKDLEGVINIESKKKKISSISIIKGVIYGNTNLKRAFSAGDISDKNLKPQIVLSARDYDFFVDKIKNTNLDSFSKITTNASNDVDKGDFGSSTIGPGNRNLVLEFQKLKDDIINNRSISIDNESFVTPIIHSVNTNMNVIENVLINSKNITSEKNYISVPLNPYIKSDVNQLKHPIFSDLHTICNALGFSDYPISIMKNNEEISLGSSKKFYQNQIKHLDQFKTDIEIKDDKVIIKKSLIENMIQYKKDEIDQQIKIFVMKIENKKDFRGVGENIKKSINSYKKIFEQYEKIESSSSNNIVKGNVKGKVIIRELERINQTIDKIFSNGNCRNTDKNVLNEYVKNIDRSKNQILSI